MTTTQAVELRKQLEIDILALLQKDEIETGLTPISLELVVYRPSGYTSPAHADLDDERSLMLYVNVTVKV